MIHMFTFMGHQHKDVTYADRYLQQYQNSYSYSCYYDIGNTLLDAECFAVRFLSYLRSVRSDSDKAILRFAYRGPSSALITTTTTDDDDKSPPSSSSSGRFAVGPVPTGSFGNHLAPNDQSRVRLREIQPGSWVLLLDQRSRSSSDDEDVFLRYSFIRIRRISAEIASEQQQQRSVPVPVPNLVEVVGGLTEFLRDTVLGIDISTCEKRVEEAEKDRAQRVSIQTGKRCIDIYVMAESSARALFNQLL